MRTGLYDDRMGKLILIIFGVRNNLNKFFLYLPVNIIPIREERKFRVCSIRKDVFENKIDWILGSDRWFVWGRNEIEY